MALKSNQPRPRKPKQFHVYVNKSWESRTIEPEWVKVGVFDTAQDADNAAVLECIKRYPDAWYRSTSNQFVHRDSVGGDMVLITIWNQDAIGYWIKEFTKAYKTGDKLGMRLARHHLNHFCI